MRSYKLEVTVSPQQLTVFQISKKCNFSFWMKRLHLTIRYSTNTYADNHFRKHFILSNKVNSNNKVCFLALLLLIVSVMTNSNGVSLKYTNVYFPLTTRIPSADDKSKFSRLFKNGWNSIFHCNIWIRHEKCIYLSTNVPIIWFNGSWCNTLNLEKSVISIFPKTNL